MVSWECYIGCYAFMEINVVAIATGLIELSTKKAEKALKKYGRPIA